MLINKDKFKIVARKARRLQIKHEKCVARYVKLCEHDFKKYKILEKTILIRKKMNEGDAYGAIRLLEEVDTIRTKIVLKAERKCRKRLSGLVPFSPEDVQYFGKLIDFWNMVIDKKCRKIISSRKIKRKAKKLHIVDYMKLSIKAIQRIRATARRDYKNSKPNAKQKRIKFLETRARIHEEANNDKLADKIREISKAEYLQEAQQEVKYTLKPQGVSNILHIEVQDPSSPNKIKEIHDQIQIEDAMKKKSKKKCRSVQYTYSPQTIPILVWTRCPHTRRSKSSKRKIHLPPVIHPDIIEFFDFLEMGEEMKDAQEIDITSSPIDFNKFWRQGRKKISSSMLHIHNGHYIAATFSYFLSTIAAHLSSLPWELGCTNK